jgi:hypothetical protein
LSAGIVKTPSLLITFLRIAINPSLLTTEFHEFQYFLAKMTTHFHEFQHLPTKITIAVGPDQTKEDTKVSQKTSNSIENLRTHSLVEGWYNVVFSGL